MTIRNHGLYFLLALCVGLLPLSAPGSMNIEHGNDMPMDCIDCGSIEVSTDNSCQETECHSTMQICSPQSSSTFLPVWAWVDQNTISATRWSGRYTAGFRPGLTEPIYRPPIT